MTSMTGHKISDDGTRIVCTAPEDAWCRSGPNCDTEEWNEHGCAEYDREHALTPGHECWQARNINAWGGPYPDDGLAPRPGAPVTLTYEGEGIVTWAYTNPPKEES